MDGIVGFFHYNNDVLGKILNDVTDTERSALCLVNTGMYQATCYAEQRREYPRLRALVSAILNTKELSDDQRTALTEIFSEVKCGIDHPQTFDVVRKGGGRGRLEQIKRIVAEILSQNVGVLPVPQEGDPTTRELYDAASAYKALSEWCTKERNAPWSTEDNRILLSNIVDKFENLPGHYIRQLFDLLDRRDTVPIRAARVVDFLRSIHKMLCERGDTESAKQIFDKSCDLTAKVHNGCNIIALYDAVVTRNGLCDMLKRHNNASRALHNSYDEFRAWFTERCADFRAWFQTAHWCNRALVLSCFALMALERIRPDAEQDAARRACCAEVLPELRAQVPPERPVNWTDLALVLSCMSFGTELGLVQAAELLFAMPVAWFTYDALLHLCVQLLILRK